MFNLGNLLGLSAGRLSVDEEIQENGLVFSEPLKSSAKGRLLTTAEIIKHYGQPGDPTNLSTVITPFPFRFDWNINQETNKITMHKKVQGPFLAVCADLLKHYKIDKIKELGIDQFGGCYNFRPQRGTEKKYEAAKKANNTALVMSYLSRHSWAIAVDLDPDRNALKTKAPKAQFSKPEYTALNDIFYSHGFIGYGRERNNDWMHFEIGLLL